jgi:hypothetical protein
MLRSVACVTQLVYHPAFDPYGALLRAIRLLSATPLGLDPMALRILEFYLLFPEQLRNIRLSPSLRSIVRKIPAEPRFPYDRLPAPRTVFERMASSSDAALQTIIARGLAIPAKDSAKLQLRRDLVPDGIVGLVAEQNQSEATLIEGLIELAATFPTNGSNGLKDRSGLAEYRYDVV